jgi:tetratricopeptide (TPR) repeat protein
LGISIEISTVLLEIGILPKARLNIEKALNIALVIGAKNHQIKCDVNSCRISMIIKDYNNANILHKKGMVLAKQLRFRNDILQLYLLQSEIHYHEKKYSKGIKIANEAIKLAKEIGTKDLHSEALVLKAINGINGILPKKAVETLLLEALSIAEQINCSEILWKVYFEYGRFLHENKQYRRAAKYYQKCIDIFRSVVSKFKNEYDRNSYLNRPDRKEAIAIMNRIVQKD